MFYFRHKGNGSSRLVTCSADRTIKLWDISRSQADALNVMKSASSPLSSEFILAVTASVSA
jgi:WD40 repeat protein